MKLSSLTEITEFFEKHNEFSENIIDFLELRDYQTTLEIWLLRPWLAVGYPAVKYDEETAKLKFQRVQEIHFYNAVNDSQLCEPEMMNWGMNEIARIKPIAQSDVLARYENPYFTFHHVALVWEYERRIEIVFAELEISLPADY